MKRSLSIGWAAALVVLSHLPQAQASYTGHTWVKISNVTLVNATWDQVSASCSEPSSASSDAWAKVGGIGDRWSDPSPVEADLVTSDSASCANAKASAGTTGEGATAEAWAGPASLGTSPWSEGFAVLERQFTATAAGTVTLTFDIDYGLETGASSGGWIATGIQLWGGSAAPGASWSWSRLTLADGQDYETYAGTLELARSYQAREIGGLYLYADAQAWATSCPCAAVPAPAAVALGMVGAAAVAVLRRRRAI